MRRLWRFRTLVAVGCVAGTAAAWYFVSFAAGVAAFVVLFLLWLSVVAPRAAGVLLLLLLSIGGLGYVHRDRFLRAWLEAEVRTALEAALGVPPAFDRVVVTEQRFLLQGLRAREITRLGPVRALAAGEVAIDVSLEGVVRVLLGEKDARVIERFTLVRPYVAMEWAPGPAPAASRTAPSSAPPAEWPPLPIITVRDGTVALLGAAATGAGGSALARRIGGELRPTAAGATAGRLTAQAAHLRWTGAEGQPPGRFDLAELRGHVTLGRDGIAVERLQERRLAAPLQGGVRLDLAPPGQPGWTLRSDVAWDEGRAGIDATLAGPRPDAPLRLEAALRGFPLTPLLAVLGVRDLEAAVADTGTEVDLEIPDAGAAGHARVVLRDVRWRDCRLAEASVTARRGERGADGRLAAAAGTPWQLSIEARGPAGDDTAFDAVGFAGLDGALELRVIDARLADLARLGLWPDDAGEPRIAGRAELANGVLTGTWEAPVLRGRLSVVDGRVGAVTGLHLTATVDGLGRDAFQATEIGLLRESSRTAPTTGAPLTDTLRDGYLKIRWDPRAADPRDRVDLSCAFQAALAAIEDYVPLPEWLGLELHTTRRSDVRMLVRRGEFTLNLSALASDEVRVGGDRVGDGWIGSLHWSGRRAEGFHLLLDLDGGRGRFDLDATASALPGPDGRWEVLISRAELGKPGQELALAGGARAELDDAGVRLDPARLEGAGGSSVRWRGAWQRDGQIDLQGDIDRLDVETVAGLVGLSHVRGTIDRGAVRIGGTVKAPSGSLDCWARGVAYGHVQDATLELHARLDGGRLAVARSALGHASGASIRVPAADLPVPGDDARSGLATLLAALTDPALALDVEGRDVPLAWLQPYDPQVEPLAGTLEAFACSLTAAAGGPVGEAQLVVGNARAQGFPCAGAVRLTLDADRLRIDDAGARLAGLGGHWRLTGEVPRPTGPDPAAWLARDGLALVVELAGVDVRAFLPPRDTGAPSPITDGRVGGRGSLRGSLARARLEGELEIADLALGDVRQIAGRVAMRTEHRRGPHGIEELLRFVDGRLSGLGLAASFGGGVPLALGLEVVAGPDGQAVLRARDPAAALGTANLQVRLTQGDLRGILAAWEAQRRVPPAQQLAPQFAGTLSGEFTMAGSWQSPSGHGRVGVADFALRTVENGSADAEVVWVGNSLELRDCRLRTPKGELDGALRVEWDAGAPPGSGRLDGKFETRRIEVDVLEAWLPEVLRRAEGTLGTPEPVRVSGTTAAPRWHGVLRIDDVRLAFTAPDLPRIERLRGDLRLDGDVLVIEPAAPVHGLVGGGDASLWGRAGLGGDADEILDLRVAATGALLLAGREGLRMRATLEGRAAADQGLRWHLWRADAPDERPGAPRPIHGAITGTVRLTGTQWSKDHDASPGEGPRPLDFGMEFPGVAQTTLDLALRTDSPVRIRNNVAWLDLEVVDALTVTGRSTAPLVVGRVQARSDGKFRLPIPFGGQIITPREFEVRELGVEFGTARPGQPKLTAALVLPYRDWEITARVDGKYYPVTNLDDIDFSSSPPLTNEEITAILVLGAPLKDSAAMRAAVFSLVGRIGLDFLNQILFRGEGGLGSEFLQRLSIEASAGDTLGDAAIRAEFRIHPLLNLYGAREADGTYSGGLGVRVALPRGR